MDSAVDTAVYFVLFMQETLGGPRATKNSIQMEIHPVTDCKSLYDAVTKETGNLEEKRTLIDIASIRESMRSDHVHWVPTTEMKADGLTKDAPALRIALTAFMMNPIVSLRDPNDPHLTIGFKG